MNFFFGFKPQTLVCLVSRSPNHSQAAEGDRMERCVSPLTDDTEAL